MLQAHCEQIFYKTRRAPGHAPVCPQSKGAAFKNHFVLPTHQMRVQQGQTRLRHALPHGLLALSTLAQVKRRRIDDRQHLCARSRCITCGCRVPGILANQHTHPHSSHFKHARFLPRHEVAALVKHLVVGQLALEIGLLDLPIAHHAGGIAADAESRRIGRQGLGVAQHDGQPL